MRESGPIWTRTSRTRLRQGSLLISARQSAQDPSCVVSLPTRSVRRRACQVGICPAPLTQQRVIGRAAKKGRDMLSLLARLTAERRKSHSSPYLSGTSPKPALQLLYGNNIPCLMRPHGVYVSLDSHNFRCHPTTLEGPRRHACNPNRLQRR